MKVSALLFQDSIDKEFEDAADLHVKKRTVFNLVMRFVKFTIFTRVPLLLFPLPATLLLDPYGNWTANELIVSLMDKQERVASKQESFSSFLLFFGTTDLEFRTEVAFFSPVDFMLATVAMKRKG